MFLRKVKLDYIKAGIGLAIGFTLVASIVQVVNDGVDNELKRMKETFGKEIDFEEKTEKAE